MTPPAAARAASVNYVRVLSPEESAEAERVHVWGFSLASLAIVALLAGTYWLHASGRDAIVVWTVLTALGITTLVLAARVRHHWRELRVFQAQVRQARAQPPEE